MEGRKKRKAERAFDRSVIKDPSKRKWSVLKMVDTNGKMFRDPKVLQDEITRAVGAYFKHQVRVVQQNESLWVEIEFDIGSGMNSRASKGLGERTERMYLVYPPHSSFLFATSFKASTSTRLIESFPILMQAFCVVFGCQEIEKVQLEGKDVTKLIGLALEKLSQGAFSLYRVCASMFDFNPLENPEHLRKKRREVINMMMCEQRKQERENLLEREEKNKVVAKSRIRKPKHKFASIGADDAAAKFNSLCFKSTNDFVVPGCSGDGVVSNFSCFIRFEGSNVLQGIEALYENDLVVQGREIPQALDPNEILAKHLGTEESEKEVSGDESPADTTNTVVWMKTG
mmetsp:Transcript_35407/g.56597  ORF Transcript_35407/g.56597 Transcript_35407/m.56597 type:complete len:343 (-) Transcript_35407:3814-4842(-)